MFTTVAPLVYGKECPEIDLAGLNKRMAGKGEIKILFFASWCGSCIDHLKKPQDEKTIFVAVFDEKIEAEKVLEAFKVKNDCFTSETLADELKVRELPAERRITF